MVTSIKNLKNQVDTRLTAGGLDELACCQLQNAQTIISGIVYSVPNIASLPSAISNEGRFIYIDDINEYRFSDGTSWIDDITTNFRTYSRELFSWGENLCGKLGDGTTITRCSPVREITSSTNWCRISLTTGNGAAAIKTEGSLWSWGEGSTHRLGTGTLIDRCTPTREFCSATDWCQVSAGRSSTVAVKTSGQIWGWGGNSCGRLGDGATIQRCSPVREICSATDWCQVSASTSATGAIKTSGEIWTWGAGFDGVLGDGTVTGKCSPIREICSATDWCQLSISQYASKAIKTSGELWAWGRNGNGQLGDGTATNKCSPIREICSGTNWCQVSGNYTTTAAIKTSGELWAWGSSGTYGMVPFGGYVSSFCSPIREICSATNWCKVQIGTCHGLAIKTDGTIWSWGQGDTSAALGIGTTLRCSRSPVREFCSATDWTDISAGARFSMGIRSKVKGFLV